MKQSLIMWQFSGWEGCILWKAFGRDRRGNKVQTNFIITPGLGGLWASSSSSECNVIFGSLILDSASGVFLQARQKNISFRECYERAESVGKSLFCAFQRRFSPFKLLYICHSRIKFNPFYHFLKRFDPTFRDVWTRVRHGEFFKPSCIYFKW